MQTFLHVRRFTMAQRLLLTVGVRPTIENVTRRQIKTLCSAVYGRQSSHNPLVPHHVRCNVPATAVQSHLYSSSAPKQSSIQRIKVVLKEYGGVAVVFHTVMSLASLGTCYLVVDRSDSRAPNSHSPILHTLILHTVVSTWERCWSISTFSLRPPPKEPPHLPWPTSCTRCSCLSELASLWPPCLS